MEDSIVALPGKFPSELVNAVACKRRPEFAKGTVENLGGLLRWFYPKGKTTRVSPAPLKRGLALISANPRKILNFYSAQDLWSLEFHRRCF